MRTRRTRTGGRRPRDDGAAATLELVVLAPVMLAMIFTLIQGAWYLHARNVAMAAAEQGVRAARALGSTDGAGTAAAEAFITQAGGDKVLPGSSVSTDGSAREVTVTVTGSSIQLVPGLPGFPVRQTATGPRERFTTAVNP